MIDRSWYVHPLSAPEDLSAGGIILRQSGSRWMVALIRESDSNDYILPKGKVEMGENLEQAARREIIEEAGLKGLQMIAYLGSYERFNFARTRWKKIHYFLFLSKEQGGKPTDSNHQYECKWFPLDNLPPVFWPEQAELLKRVRANLKQWLPQLPPSASSPRHPHSSK